YALEIRAQVWTQALEIRDFWRRIGRVLARNHALECTQRVNQLGIGRAQAHDARAAVECGIAELTGVKVATHRLARIADEQRHRALAARAQPTLHGMLKIRIFGSELIDMLARETEQRIRDATIVKPQLERLGAGVVLETGHGIDLLANRNVKS